MKVALVFWPVSQDGEYGEAGVLNQSGMAEWWFPLKEGMPLLIPGTKIHFDDDVDLEVVKCHFFYEDNLIGLEVRVALEECAASPEEFAKHIQTKWLSGTSWYKS